MSYIKKEPLCAWLSNMCVSENIIKAIEDDSRFPPADVLKVRHGEWQYEQLDEYKFYKVTCPYCDAYYMGNYDAYNEPDEFNYCPNCGAKMGGERREG